MKFKTLLIFLLLSIGVLQSQIPIVKGEITQNQSYIETYEANENKTTHCIYFPSTEQTCGPNNSTIFGISVLNNSNYIVSKVEIEDRSINAKSIYNITFGDRESRLIQFSDPSYFDLSVGEVKTLSVTLYSNNKIICYREIEIRVTASGSDCDCKEVEADVDSTTSTEAGCSDDEGTAIISLSKAISDYKVTLRKIKGSGTKTITGTASTSSIPLTGLSSGLWLYTIEFSNNCKAVTGTFSISETKDCCDLQGIIKSTTPATCGEDGRAIFSFTGGTPDYRLETINIDTGETWWDTYPSPEDAELTDLTPGNFEYIITDGSGCEVTGSFQILDSQEDCCDLQIEILKTTEAGCSGDNGTATISIAGGEPVYTLTFDESPIDMDDIEYDADGTYLIEGLAPGFYGYTIVDESDPNCVFKDGFSIKATQDNTEVLDCNGIGRIVIRDEGYPRNVPAYYEFVSSVETSIDVKLVGFDIPDNIIVSINGEKQLSFTAGSFDCDDQGGVTDREEIRSFDIEECDLFHIEILPDFCRLGLFSDFRVELDCTNKKRANNNVNNVLNIFPNPVQHTLNITNYNSGINYETVRIFDKYGKVIITKKISNTSDLKIDTSFLSTGLYLIELIDNTGNKITEKFIKEN